MRIQVVEGPVRQNIELFLKIVNKVEQKAAHKKMPSERVFRAWVNRQTGQFFVDEVFRESSHLAKREWKQIEVSCIYDKEMGEICFLAEEAEFGKECFHCDDLTPIAYSIMRQTLNTLNTISQRLKGPSDLETKLTVISRMEVENPGKHGERSILIEAWYVVDRFKAEELLWDKPSGTYLFRKDSYAELLEEKLRQQHPHIKCYTLTYSQGNRKFSDLTLVHGNGYWIVYDDDPSLDERRFLDILELLDTYKELLKFPLYHQL